MNAKYQVSVILTGNMNIGVLLLTSRTRKSDSVMDVLSLELCAKSQCEVWQITGLVK